MADENTGEAAGRPGGGIGAVDRAFAIVELIGERTVVGVTEVADELGVAKSTAHDHLATLRERGYVVRDEDGYKLGLEFLRLGETTRQRHEGYAMAREKLEQLAEETQERAQFIVEENGVGVYVYREMSPRAVRTDSAIGGHIPLHATAAGKAILSHYDDERVEALLDDLERVNENTTTDREALFDELATIRDRGYAVNDEENTRGLRAIGAPVVLPDGSLLGAISVSGPTHRMKGDRFASELPDLLLGTVNELELNIAYA